MRNTRLGLLLTSLSWIGAFCAEAEPDKVGDFGTASALVFEGTESIPEDAIRRALRINPVFIRTSHPVAPYAEFREAVTDLIHRGYLNTGFPDARVEAIFDEAGSVTRVKVNEGPRFLFGDLTIEGNTGDVPKALLEKMLTEATDFSDPDRLRFLRNRAHFLPAAKTLTLKSREEPSDASAEAEETDDEKELKIRVTSSTNTNYFGYAYLMPGGTGSPPGEIAYEPNKDPSWEKDEPISFVDSPEEEAAESVNRVLEELGFFSAKVQAKTEIDPVDGTVDLHVRVSSPGPRATLGEVRIDGLERHTTEEVASFLGLEPGSHFNRSLLIEAERKLIDSGRFIAHWFEIHEREDDDNRFDLTLTVTEFLAAPKLGEPFSPEEEAGIRFARWMSTIPDRDEDLVCKIRELPETNGEPPPAGVEPILEFQLILSPSDGLGILSGDGPDTALVFGGEQFGVYQNSASARTRSVSPPYGGTLIPTVVLFPNADSQTSNTINLMVSSKNNRPSQQKSPLDPRFYVAPVVGLQMLNGKNTAISKPRPGVMRATRKGEDSSLNFEIDMATGRLLSMTTDAGVAGGEFAITSRKGALKSELARIQAATESLPNDYNPDRPVGSLFGPVIRSLLESELMNEILAGKDLEVSDSIVRHLDNADVMAPFETLLLSWWRGYSYTKTFSIPVTREEFESSMNQMLFGVATGILGSAEPHLPKQSWLWKVIRETIHLMGNSPHTPEMLDELDSEAVDMGPVGHLVTARILKMAKSPQAYRFAWGGLERLETVDFQDDWRFFFDSESPAPVAAHGASLVEALGRIYSDTADPETRDLGRKLTAAAASFREGNPGQFIELTGQALDKLWEDSGREVVEAELRSMLGLSPDVPIRELAAAVNDIPILREEVRCAEIFQTQDNPGSTGALKALIAEKPLMVLFEKLGGKLSPAILDQAVDQLVATRYGGNRETFEAALKKEAISLEQLKTMIGIGIAAAVIRGKIMKEMAEPTDEELETFIREHPDLFVIDPAVLLHSISVPKSPDTKKAIESARKAIATKPNRFEDFAKKLSKDSKGAAGGNWSWVDPGQFNETFSAQIQKLEPGEMSPVFEDGDFYRLLRVEKTRETGPATLEQLDAKSRDLVKQAVRKAGAEKWEAAQAESRFIKIFNPPGP